MIKSVTFEAFRFLVLLGFVFFLPAVTWAIVMSGGSHEIFHDVLDGTGQTNVLTAGSNQILVSVGQPATGEEMSSGSNLVNTGFLVFYLPGVGLADIVIPRMPVGVQSSWNGVGSALEIRWKPVEYNTDGSPVTDLAGYNIYRSTSPEGPYLEKLNSSPLNSLTFTDTSAQGRSFYYFVRAQDKAGNENKDMFTDSLTGLSPYIVNTKKEGLFLSETDPKTQLIIPELKQNILNKEQNTFGDDLRVKVERVSSHEGNGKLRVYNYTPQKVVSGEKVDGVTFEDSPARIVMSYSVTNGLIDGTNVPSQDADKSLVLFRFNGLEYVRLGGEVDKENQTVSISTKKLSQYSLQVMAAPTGFTLFSVIPRIFSPNGDNRNDKVTFVLANPGNDQVFAVIYDREGRVVKEGLPSGDISNSLVWDGANNSGQVVRQGVYIYQIQAGAKRINGTVIVAK